MTRLSPIELPSSIDATAIPKEIAARLAADRTRIEAFQDRWDRPQIEQFVAADYPLIYQTLDWILQTQTLIGRRFLEWGCGFAVVSAIADRLGFDTIGIEAERDLIRQGRTTIASWGAQAELFEGNFLPRGSSELAEDDTLPSLGHPVEDAYRAVGLDLDDFAIVYSYPWPGEEDFHEQVFAHHAADGAFLLLFCGPNDVRLWQKQRQVSRRRRLRR